MAELIRAPKLSDQVRALSARPTLPSRRREPGKAKNTDQAQAPVPRPEQPGLAASEQTPRPIDKAPSKPGSATKAAHTERRRSEGPDTAMDARILAAEHRLHKLQEELARERKIAVEEGRAQGYRDGMESAREALDEELQRLKMLIESLSGEMSKRLSDVEDAMVEVVYASIAKILGEAMQTPDGVVAVVRNTIAQLTRRDKLNVRVSPDDFALLEAARHKLLDGLDDTSVQLVPDGRVRLGGCLLETESGSLDGRLEVQLQRLSEVMLSTRAQRQIGAET